MGEVVNLNKARKARVKTGQAVQAAANRTKHGRTKSERAAEDMEAERRDHLLDGARRED